MPRYSQAQRDDIRATILDLYLLGMRARPIQQYLADPKRGPAAVSLSERQVYAYLEEIRKEVRASAKFDREEEIGKGLARLQDIFKRCMVAKDFRGALRVQREINLMTGAIIHRHEHQGVTLEDWLRGGRTAPTEGKERVPLGAAAGGAAAADTDGREDDDDTDEPGRPAVGAGGGDGGGEGPTPLAPPEDLDDDEPGAPPES